MARRSHEEADDSLELFLSTSCDSFGGIVFITLLVCLLPAKSATEAYLDLQNNRDKLAKIQREASELDAKAAKPTAPKAEEPPPKQKSDNSAEELARLEEELKSRQAELAELKATVGE